MDTFSHALWGKALFGYRGARFSPFFFGAAPDLIAFVPYFIFKLIKSSNAKLFGKPEIAELPNWVLILYDFSHSFVTSFIVLGILFFFKKRILAFASLSWSFHILLDFPFHTKEFFPTKIFWPISDIYYDGISWGIPQVWLTNILLLFLILFYRFRPGKDLET